MVKIRIKFTRGESLRFLSHLDQQRLFQRAMRRAQIPIAFSQGFNPHPILSFANAMKVGMTSDCEYADIGLDFDSKSEIDSSAIKKRLNAAMPKGIKVLEVEVLPDESKKLSKLIESASYDVNCLGLNVNDIEYFKDELKKFQEQDSIIIEKINKKKKKVETDIRPNFEYITTEKDGKNVIFHIKILPISGSLISPEIVIKAFLNSVDYYEKSINVITHRSNLELSQ